MKLLQRINEIIFKTLALAMAFTLGMGCTGSTAQGIRVVMTQPNEPAPMMMTIPGYTIRLALLLDTSNSMDGLIDQAKSQLWVIVNELAKARYNDQTPFLKISLYEYGNDGLPSKENYIRQVTPFTTDLDSISQELFALKTNGGQEFCGAVIGTSLKELTWSTLTSDLEMIVIAGNEPFTQGPIDPKKTCASAKEKNIFVNTIYCGDALEGIKTGWKLGADLAQGSYMNINQDKQTVYIQTPYDSLIGKLNDSLNNTYIPYGSYGEMKYSNMKMQDVNSENYTEANKVNRTKTKVSSVYKVSSWDMVDAKKESKDFDVKKLKNTEIPKEMQNMTPEQKERYIDDKMKERDRITQRIKEMDALREQYIADKQLKEKKTKRLDTELIAAIHQQAAMRGFTFEEK